MKWIIAILTLLLLALQYRLWVGEGSLAHVSSLKQELAEQRKKNDELRARNAMLDARVRELKEGLDSVEELARDQLGMTREDETFFLVIDKKESSGSQ
jgi:cell division protein FtsB